MTAPAFFEMILQKMQSSFMCPFLFLDLVSLVCPPGKISAQREEIFLNTLQNLLSLRILHDSSSKSYLRVELVNRPVRFNSRVLFPYSGPTIETSLASVTRPRVSLHQVLESTY